MAPKSKKAPAASASAPASAAVVVDVDVAEPAPAEPVVVDVVEEIVPEPTQPRRQAPQQQVTFVLDNNQLGRGIAEGDEGDEGDEDYIDDEDDEDEDDVEFDEEGDEDDLASAIGQVAQLLVTEDGEAVGDVLRGILDAIDKQNKILYRGLQLLETKLAGGGRR